MVAAIIGENSMYRIVDSLVEFARAKQNAVDRRHGASVVALISEHERSTIFNGVSHCYTADEYQNVICVMDKGLSVPGV